PENLNWDSWLGVASMRPYSSAYLPFKWRGWYDFGCGALGDMACHVLGAPNMALMLGAPTSVEAIKQEKKNSLTFPESSAIRFDFPARGSLPAVKLFWHAGVPGAPCGPEGIPADEKLGDLPPSGAAAAAPRPPQPRPATPSNDGMIPREGGSGTLFIGDKGFLTAGEYGGSPRIVPASRMKDYKMPAQLMNRTPGTYRDWIRAAKGGEPSCSNFGVSGPFTEWILLGVIALRVEGKLEWDAAKMRFTNNNEANQYIKPKIRSGWNWKVNLKA